jgi:hypothetical protein
MRYEHSVVVFMRRSFRDHPCFMVLFRAFGSTMHTQPSCSNACNASGSFVSYTPCSHPSPTELESEQRIREHLTHTHAHTHIWLSWLARGGEVCHQEHTSTSGSARCAANIRPASLNCFSSITTSIRLKDWRPWGSTRLTRAPGYSSVLGARVLR